MRAKLWPLTDSVELASEANDFAAGADVPTIDAVFIAERDGCAIGFLELSLREFADGCDSMPVPYVEGWYVDPMARGKGLGRALMGAAEAWSIERGFTELASDTEIENEASLRAHERCGFEEMERLIKLRKQLSRLESTTS